MRIIEEEQLGFEDVLIRPARSDINSRSEVDVFRIFSKEGRHEFSCIPVCCANMGSIAVPEMAKIFVKKGLLCAMEKHISYVELRKMYSDLVEMEMEDKVFPGTYRNRIALSIGTKEEFTTLDGIDVEFGLSIINIDVANGYMTSLQDRVREVRKKFPHAWIIAGTVVTGDIVTDLLNCGADIIRCGIGGGCFTGGMKVQTDRGLIEIRNVDIGDHVLTHTGKYEKVVNKFCYNSHKLVININGIKCTPNHKFLVVNNKDIPKITEQNYMNYCFWVEASELDSTKHKLIKISLDTKSNSNHTNIK